jgi:hypothetical protein
LELIDNVIAQALRDDLLDLREAKFPQFIITNMKMDNKSGSYPLCVLLHVLTMAKRVQAILRHEAGRSEVLSI